MPTKYTIEDAPPAQSKYTVEDADATPPPAASPEKKDFIDAPSGSDWRDRLTKIDPHQPVHSAADLGREALRGLGNIGAGGMGLVLHPVDTLVGIGRMAIDPAGSGMEAGEAFAKQPLETAESMAGQAAVMDAAAAATPRVLELRSMAAKAAEKVRKGAQSMVGAGEGAVKTEVAKTAKAAGEKAKTTEEQNRAELSRHDKDVKDADRANVNAHVQYLSDTADAKQANAGAKAAVDSRAGLEKQVAEKSALRKEKIAMAQKAAKADLDKRYEEQRELLGDELIPDTFVKGAIDKNGLTSLNIGERAVDAYQGYITNPDPTLPKELKEIQGRAGERLGWRELQGIRTKLGKALSGGKLNGEMYQGYKAALGVVDDGLQKIADNMGVGDQVRKNRADYAHYMQTFHDPISEPNTVARKTQTATSPDFIRDTEEAERRANLDKYDPSIGHLGGEIDSLAARHSALPPEGMRPKAETPKYPEPKEVTPPRTNPIEVPDVSTREIRERKLDQWTSGESQLSKFQVRSLIGGGIGAVIGGIFEGKIGAGVGGMMGSAFGPAAIAKFVAMDSVREWLTRPPVGEVETLQKLPYADRVKIYDGLKQTIEQAQRQGVKVDPKLAALVGATIVTPRTRELMEMRKTQ